jgi:chaperone required for assembly of F1-ATPase
MTDNPEPPPYVPAASPRSSEDDVARQLPKRFYGKAAVARHEIGYAVELDGRGIKTPKRTALNVPTEALAAAIAAEWNALGELIDPEQLPLTKIANTAIDGVTGREGEIHDDIVRYIGNDLLFYRADIPQELVDRQAEAWNPVLDWFAETFQATFKSTVGIMPIEQNFVSVAKAASALTNETAMSLAPLHVITTLTGSALLAIAHLRGRLTADQVWQATHIDEDWQIEQWGSDDEAEERRVKRRTELQSAVDFLVMLRR